MIISAVIIGGLGFLEQIMQFWKAYMIITEYFSGHCDIVGNSLIWVTCRD